ncbi:putative N(G),N(G)-dimethylarginine dimethylaminohydrolase 1 [Apostichopus japonicus]|uniref:Putative N(G),N(G)-dimethylarginine dimethylaminohydrolase 1 n=1 Tax=Stichopus japonicus TaxID=307972 RepID=A0A2G8LNZ8_STIJA|nr:putative N(G),N(G)-dimethylarginine dimethylaminohydrolase 1 [Apostichopus japonicus]
MADATDVERLFTFDAVVMRGIPDSLKAEALRTEDLGEVDLEEARKHHEAYQSVMRDQLKLHVEVLEADESLPDCCFVEDCAVVVDGVALITCPGSPSRRPEVTLIKRILGGGLGQEIVEMTEKGATLDGGDVLFTGKEFFVGLSSRTNQKGANSLANAFPNYPVSGIKVNGHLHLKSMMSMAGPGIIAVGSSDHSQKAIRQIKKVSNFDYTTVTLPDDAAANCVYINKTLLHCSQDEFPESYKVFAEKFPKTPRVAIPNNELFKVDGALTCKSLLICKKPKV